MYDSENQREREDTYMGEKRVFQTEKAAVTGGPYSQAVIHRDLIYISGQVAVDPVTNKTKPGTIEEESELALENIRIILEEAGSSLDRVLKITVYLANIEEYGLFNEVYKRCFQKDRAARTCIQAGGLPMGFRVEIDAIAAL
jgi:2-iminobutanoate/2-iminopropanoate deaminase